MGNLGLKSDAIENQLIEALKTHDINKCMRLLQLHANLHTIKFIYNYTVLHYAAYYGVLEVVQILINEYQFDPHCVNDNNITPLHDAALCGHLSIVKYLVTDCHCNPLCKDVFGLTPLDDAKTGGHQAVVKYLESVTDHVYESSLTKAMKDGSGQMKLCNVTVHGPPGAGKTSLKRVIIGLSPLPLKDQNTTDIIENAVRAVRIDRITADGRRRVILKEVDNEKFIQMLARKVKSHHVTCHQIQEPLHKPELQLQKSVSVESENASLQITCNSEAMRSIKEQLPKIKPSTELFDADWIHLLDSGGQPQFLDVLPLLFCNQSLHIVVIRLTEGLNDKAKVRYYNKGRNIYTLPDHLTLSNIEIIEGACQMAEAQAASRKSVPKVIVVGTHKDKLGINSEAKLKEVNRELRKLHQKYSHVLIPKSSDEVIFAINAMAPDGEERQRYTEELQKCILGTVKETGDLIDVPLKWLAFHLDLDKAGAIVQKSECYRRGEMLGMEKSEVDNALKFFNKFSLLLHYPDDIPDLIFTKMDPLISRLSMLITASFITPGYRVTAPYDTLRQKGLFNKAIFSTIFEDVHNGEEEFSDDDFLKLLECLKIAVCIGNDDYFLPCALSLQPSSNDSSLESSCVPLVFSWGEMILPHGFFLTLIVELLRQQEYGDNLHFELKKDVTQCRQEIQLIIAKSEIPGYLKIVNRKRWIEVCYSCSTLTYCSDLREIISNAVDRVVKRFQHTGIEFPTIGFRCRLCSSNDHYCVLSGNKHNIMVQCNHSNGPITPEMMCWIERCDSNDLVFYPTPHLILKKHTSELLGIISDPDKLAVDLWSDLLIPDVIKDKVLNTVVLTRFQKASKLVDAIYRYLEVFKTSDVLITFCEILKKQHDLGLTRIADEMLNQLSGQSNQ